MQMIKMNQMVMLALGAVEQITDNTCILGDFDANGIFDCPHRGQIMGVRSDPAGSLDEQRGVTRIPSLQDHFDPPEHLA